MKYRLHNINPIPDGKRIGDILPVFAKVENAFHVGEPNKHCAGCGKPFSVARKPCKAIRLFPKKSPIPLAFQYRICGKCLALYQHGGTSRESLLAGIENFHLGIYKESMT